ncbi:MAG: UDP-N-acetylmuramoyl-tripeptide--D-alanyl-D-alanine ligase [Patescibacteria group bacterium]|nr:UDP-N-acetylmuramoyl-tripeptide--D-alanyl-D-alanine ligase [Patescibacteria group bacterium]
MSYQPQGLKKIYHQTRRLIAKKWLSFFHPLQIGITGSQGKTSVTQTLAKILKNDGPTIATDTNLDTNFNVPITALKVKPWTKYVVWELGVDHIGEMDKHLEIAKPKIGIITGISPVHTDKEHFGSIDNLIKEKRKLIENLPNKKGVAILNWDDENVRKMTPFTKAGIFFYGTDKKNCQVYFDPKKIKITIQGTEFILKYKNKNYKFKTKLIGRHHSYNFSAIFSCLINIFNNPKKAYFLIKKTLKSLKPLRGRMSIEKGPLKTLILNDSLRANPKSTEEGIKTFYEIPYKKGRKIAVLGVMGELYDPVLEHKKTAKTLIEFQPNIIIGVGNHRKYTINEAINLGFPKNNIFYADDVFEAAKILKNILKPGDLIYLKSSLLRNLWRIIKILKNESICCNNELCSYDHCKQ